MTLFQAIEFKEENVFRGGYSKMKQIKLTSTLELGTGIPLYFQFVKSFAILFFFLTILSIPSFIFVYSGSAINPTVSKLYRLSKTIYSFDMDIFNLLGQRCIGSI